MDINRETVAVVTGSASGIGFGIAKGFLAAGASVVLADVEKKALADAATELAATVGSERVLAVETDVMEQDSVDALADAAWDRFGRVDVVCNNAGVNGAPETRMWDLPLGEWQWILGVNLGGVIHGIRSFVPRMVDQGSGHVVNTASMAGVRSLGVFAPYAATKHAILSLSESLRLQFQAENLPLGVTVLIPSLVATRIRASARNRPERFGAPESPVDDPTAGYPPDADLVSPDAIGEMVVEAVRRGQFYLPTHANAAGGVRARFAELIAAFDAVADQVKPGPEGR